MCRKLQRAVASSLTLALINSWLCAEAHKCIYEDDKQDHFYFPHTAFHFQLTDFSYAFVFTFLHLSLSPYHTNARSSWASCKAPEVWGSKSRNTRIAQHLNANHNINPSVAYMGPEFVQHPKSRQRGASTFKSVFVYATFLCNFPFCTWWRCIL